ncbi:MAG: ABC transporter permease [Hoeflea sp.]|uniref:ABC transporter permease n=1 Tax=Hoeflea sp. TaxID=1940281 RepID=UPI001D8867ED|nr:ABC transporter permease [Hoeflea sp.]MBU4531990.1 ABC transporter permease [Alphaproteobacteria bacterium]MBU4546412.1 ABC transporter permease [Alphaproteobacteria bacterium]MBU4549541.1 ABC transporter permease [Alphaproteobacteria bacterium]MBV1722716.1 ABC transporter permease [Hoeflea sp.]MBV1782655.1 ABC transporter permease [Hoeflea sp.]
MTTLDEIIGKSQHQSWFSRIRNLQVFWVLTAAVLACLALTILTDTFASERNLFNVARNFAFVAIIAIGMTAVIASGGIDLSVGSSVVLSAMVISVAMASGLPFWFSVLLALGAALLVGLLNGVLIAYAGMPAFVVTLGTLSATRSLAMVLSDNKMIWQFGPDHDILLWVGGGSTFGLPHPLFVLTVLTIVMSLAFKWSRWGQHLFAIGGNENAAVLTGIPVKRLKVSIYMFSAFTAGLAGILMAGWLGSVTTNLGQAMELTVIAAAVIGGANLAGGEGTALGAVVGALLIEVIRNSLILLGISTFWQGMFIGTFIIVAVAFDRFRNFRS